MKAGPSQEPAMRADHTLDAALITIVLALFVASGFGLTERPGGVSEWDPKEWKGVHDCAKGLILPVLALRFALGTWGSPGPKGLRNSVLVAMLLCWVGDIALTFSGPTAFVVGLVHFLLGHVVFLLAFRHLFKLDWPVSERWIQVMAFTVIVGISTFVSLDLWDSAGELAPAVGMYAFVIAGVAFCSWRTMSGPGVFALRVGTTAFMASDLILAYSRFGEVPLPNGHFWVMATYIAAQWALTVGFTQVALHQAAKRP